METTDGTNWLLYDTRILPFKKADGITDNIPNQLIMGISAICDTANNEPPNNTYGGNTTPYQNKYNYTSQRVRMGLVRAVFATLVAGKTHVQWQGGRLQYSTAITGPWLNAPDQATNPQDWTIAPPNSTTFFRVVSP